MQIIDNIIILLLPVIAFFAGKKISDNYNESVIDELRYLLRINAAEKGVGYVAYPQKTKCGPIGQDFMDKLKQTGHATQAIRTPRS